MSIHPEYISVQYTLKESTRESREVHHSNIKYKSSPSVISHYPNDSDKRRIAPIGREHAQFSITHRKATYAHQLLFAQQSLVPKSIGFTSGFIPITSSQCSQTRSSKCLDIHKIKQYNEVTPTKCKNEVDQRALLGLSHSNKKWIWSGSNGKIKGNCIDGWHKYIEMSQKIVA